MKVFCQFGWSRKLKEGQLLEVCHNDKKLEMKDGDYLTPQASRKTEMFYMKAIECAEGDIIKIECKVGLRLLGEDENRSFTALFRVSEQAEDTDFVYPKVGYGWGFPLLRGKIEQIVLLTAKEKRLEELKGKMENESNENMAMGETNECARGEGSSNDGPSN